MPTNHNHFEFIITLYPASSLCSTPTQYTANETNVQHIFAHPLTDLRATAADAGSLCLPVAMLKCASSRRVILLVETEESDGRIPKRK